MKVSINNPVVIHYHLFRGGVSQLMLSGLDILVNKGLIKGGITIASGTSERSEWFIDALKKIAPTGFSVKLVVIPELAYWSSSAISTDEAAERIRNTLLSVSAPGALLWAHNPTLGKNPAYAKAMRQIAVMEPDRPILMHVHDSAEQGRWPNLGLMRSELPETPYFISKNTRWLTINRTDESFFNQAGMPNGFLHYFPDIISQRKPSENRQRAVIETALYQYAEQNGFHFSKGGKWALFAGRTIRRKNIMESLLIQQCAENPLPLLVTLPSDSPDDKPYEEVLFRLLRKYKAGIGGFGPELVGTAFSLADLAKESALIQSSSVMEGFGLPYLEFPAMGCPLLARRICTMRDFEYASHAIPHHYYDSFRVPVGQSLREHQKARYLEKVRLLGDHFGIRGWRRESLCAFFETHFNSPAVDFSFLSFSLQTTIVDNLNAAIKDEIRALNSDVYSELDSAINDTERPISECRDAVNSSFGSNTYAEHFETLINSIYPDDKRGIPEFAPYIFAQRLFESYFSPTNIRLLLDYKPYLTNTL
jgi:hypothetical protein